MDWYIGQKIVAIRTHSQGCFKEGNIFKIDGIKQGCCGALIDVGIRSYGTFRCGHCRKYGKTSNEWYFNESNFAPLDEMQAHESAIKELLKENEIHENIH